MAISAKSVHLFKYCINKNQIKRKGFKYIHTRSLFSDLVLLFVVKVTIVCKISILQLVAAAFSYLVGTQQVFSKFRDGSSWVELLLSKD